MSLYDAAAFLIGAGLSLAFALAWLRAGARRRQRVLESAAPLRARFEADPLGALEDCGDWLARAGLARLEWDGEWYGVPVRGRVEGVPGGRSAPRPLERSMTFPDLALRLRVDLGSARGEARLFAEQAAQWLFLVVEGALASRELALNASMAQRARLAVFVQHDMRNLAQWVELVADQVGGAASDAQLLEAARRMRSGAGAARDRADRIAQAIGKGAASTRSAGPLPQVLDLQLELASAAAAHQVDLELRFEPGAPLALEWDRQAWDVVLDNVLGNVSRLARAQGELPRCTVRIGRQGTRQVIAFDTPELPLELPLVRLFEPWTGTRPGGSGLGLYQARRTAVAAGAQLLAEPCGRGLSVQLVVDCKKI